MTKRMLIDAAHPEETRVVVVEDRQLLDFDFESSTKRQLKGNVYLAKVTRVEPSLQAAFVEYGGNRHGFLPFAEIHPDYFQIPAADRAMLEELEREATSKTTAAVEAEPERANGAEDEERPTEITHDLEEETADVVDEYARRRAKLLRNYKIQEVVKRRQIMLVQVVKEERGNKGAALTTYLSLAGRYCVLMPNTPRGGGISRKIASPADRRRLKDIAQELEVPLGMGLIIRTAGAERTKAEVKRDYEYLIRLWDEIRETTLKSIAPALIYEEGDLIKRAMRDLYTRDIEEVLVEGDEGYKNARRLMQMLMPSRARLVKPYLEDVPLFFRHQVEDQLDKIYNPVVRLPSGGSIVIHTTEALTAVDVNSGRSTRERHIDETAVKTNLEAADEVARQLRLRDLAGLIVIDFIDMGEARHQRAVEKRLRDSLKLDRARIQLGRISVFGLMELSRQRLRPSLLELSAQVCPVCQGAGVVRSTESCALQALRMIQDIGIRGETAVLRVGVPVDVGLYLLNHKREPLVRLEQRYAMRVHVAVSEHLHSPQVELEVVEKREAEPATEGEVAQAAPAEPVPVIEEQAVERVAEREPPRREATPAERAPSGERPAGEEGEDGGRKRRRRRRRRRRSGEPAVTGVAAEATMDAGDVGHAEGDETDRSEDMAEEAPAEQTQPVMAETATPHPVPVPVEPIAAAAEPILEPIVHVEPAISAPVESEPAAPKPKARRRRAVAPAAVAEELPPAEPATTVEPEAAPAPKPRRRRAKAAAPVEPVNLVDMPAPAARPARVEEAAPALEPAWAGRAHVAAETPPDREPEPTLVEAEVAAQEPRKPARRGWWNRLVS